MPIDRRIKQLFAAPARGRAFVAGLALALLSSLAGSIGRAAEPGIRWQFDTGG